MELKLPTQRDDVDLKVIAIVQARLGSVRMPAKVLKESLGKPLLLHLIERLQRSSRVSQIVLAIPSSPVNNALEEFGESHGVPVVRGSELDVLDRFMAVANSYPADVYVRVTGDCPLIDPAIVDSVIDHLSEQKLEYARTNLVFPDGLDVEAFTSRELVVAAESARDNFDREHVTPFMRRRVDPDASSISPEVNISRLRLTIDEPEDFEVIDGIFSFFKSNEFSFTDISILAGKNPSLFVANQHLKRDEGSVMSSGEKLWSRAKKTIPGGNMLLSKRAEMFLPRGWPAYFSRTSGCEVWDLDDVPYLDVGYMGIGTNILGYSHPVVDEAVREVVRLGNLSTLNCPEEVLLAERLVGIHTWAKKVKLTRSGGEAAAVAVRIARAASGKDGVAFCGYHGWHDWYLSANLEAAENLGEHLLSGLEPKGVPQALSGVARPFRYNRILELEEILQEGNTGVVFMEVERNFPPAADFLEQVRDLSNKYGAVLVFDECTSGFRRNLGGLHLHYEVTPDIAIFGKTLGNGYAINAVIGKESVMEFAQTTFISSTFWTERIGPAAALASLRVMEDEEAPSRVHEIGIQVRSAWESIAADSGLRLNIQGIPSLSTFNVEGFDASEVRTFITQEMLHKGFLATTAFYSSIAHTPEILHSYFEALQTVFSRLALHNPDKLSDALPHGVAASGFTRIN